MAVQTPHLLLICTVPAVVTLLTIFWTRRNKKPVVANSSSTRKAQLTSTQETEVNADDCVHDSSLGKNAVLEEDATRSSDNVEEYNVSSIKPEITDSNKEEYLYPKVTEANSDECAHDFSLGKNAVPTEDTAHSSDNVEECHVNSIKPEKTDSNKEEYLYPKVTSDVESQNYIGSSSPEVEEKCTVLDASNELNLQAKATRAQDTTINKNLVEELQDLLPNMHAKYHEICADAKIEQECSFATVIEGVEDAYQRDSLASDELCCDDKQVGSTDCHVNEESRDSALGGEEDFATVESSICSPLGSTPTASPSPIRAEFREVLFAKEQQSRENSVSEHLNDLDEALESPPHSIYSDEHSEGSCDSGKGGSDIHIISSSEASQLGENALLIYEFELPQDLCGRLIGRFGKHVNSIKSSSNASVFIKRHPFNSKMKLCVVQGTKSEIQNGLELIRKRFPLSQYPAVTLVQVNIPLGCGVIVPETLQLHLPEGVTCDVILSSMVSAGHFFIQQPTHPTYPSLNRLDMCMTSCYTQLDTPEIPHPVEVGVICACPVLEGWFRAQVVHLSDDSEECDIKFVDYGGYSCVPLSRLRQIRSDFMTLPFQASECYLANVTPISETWSLEACATFEELAQGQILQALVVGHAEDNIPYVHLYRVQGVSTVFINRELVNRGVARWLEAES